MSNSSPLPGQILLDTMERLIRSNQELSQRVEILNSHIETIYKEAKSYTENSYKSEIAKGLSNLASNFFNKGANRG